MSATATGSEGLVPVAGRHSAVVDQNCFRHQTSGSQDPGRRQVRSSGPARNIRLFSSKISFPRSEALFSPCKRVYFIQLDLLTAGEVLLICWSLRLSSHDAPMKRPRGSPSRKLADATLRPSDVRGVHTPHKRILRAHLTSAAGALTSGIK